MHMTREVRRTLCQLNQPLSDLDSVDCMCKDQCPGRAAFSLTEHASQELGDNPSLTVKSSMAITFSFLYLFVASGLLGAAFGLTAALLLKASPSIHVHQVSCCCFAELHS